LRSLPGLVRPTSMAEQNMVSDEKIRSLCDRVVRSKGEEFKEALLELQEALELHLGSAPDGKGASGKN
jgi:hypothetical protein